MQKLLPTTFCILLLFLGFVGGNAYAQQYIPYIGVIWDHTPDVCILDNTLQEAYHDVAKNAVNGWSNGLNHLSHSKTAWNMTLRVVDKIGMSNCDITFIYDLEQHDWVDYGSRANGNHTGDVPRVKELGITECNNDGYAYQIPYHCTIKMHVLSMDERTIPQVSQHEFGHALGLGHRVGDTREDAMAAYLSDDLMYAFSKPFNHITNDDILALIHLYGHDGFHGNNNPDWGYIIHHPTHVKVYCNGVNATGGICDNPVKIG